MDFVKSFNIFLMFGQGSHMWVCMATLLIYWQIKNTSDQGCHSTCVSSRLLASACILSKLLWSFPVIAIPCLETWFSWKRFSWFFAKVLIFFIAEKSKILQEFSSSWREMQQKFWNSGKNFQDDRKRYLEDQENYKISFLFLYFTLDVRHQIVTYQQGLLANMPQVVHDTKKTCEMVEVRFTWNSIQRMFVL